MLFASSIPRQVCLRWWCEFWCSTGLLPLLLLFRDPRLTENPWSDFVLRWVDAEWDASQEEALLKSYSCVIGSRTNLDRTLVKRQSDFYVHLKVRSLAYREAFRAKILAVTHCSIEAKWLRRIYQREWKTPAVVTSHVKTCGIRSIRGLIFRPYNLAFIIKYKASFFTDEN